MVEAKHISLIDCMNICCHSVISLKHTFNNEIGYWFRSEPTTGQKVQEGGRAIIVLDNGELEMLALQLTVDADELVVTISIQSVTALSCIYGLFGSI